MTKHFAQLTPMAKLSWTQPEATPRARRSIAVSISLVKLAVCQALRFILIDCGSFVDKQAQSAQGSLQRLQDGLQL